jgi:hypothetical protein
MRSNESRRTTISHVTVLLQNLVAHISCHRDEGDRPTELVTEHVFWSTSGPNNAMFEIQILLFENPTGSLTLGSLESNYLCMRGSLARLEGPSS